MENCLFEFTNGKIVIGEYDYENLPDTGFITIKDPIEVIFTKDPESSMIGVGGMLPYPLGCQTDGCAGGKKNVSNIDMVIPEKEVDESLMTAYKNQKSNIIIAPANAKITTTGTPFDIKA